MSAASLRPPPARPIFARMAIPPDHRLDTVPHPGLGELLATAARRLPDGALAAGTGLGVVLGAAALVVGEPWRVLALAGLAAAAFGAWGILDRTLAERGSTEPTTAARLPTTAARLRIVALLLAATGWLALGAFVLAGFGHVMDGVIH